MLFSDNSITYAKEELTKYLQNIKELNGNDKSGFPIYYNSNLKLDYAKATQNVKHLAQDKKSSEKSDNSSLVKILWENIKADFEKLKDFNKLKSEEENIFIQQKDDSMLLKSLLK